MEIPNKCGCGIPYPDNVKTCEGYVGTTDWGDWFNCPCGSTHLIPSEEFKEEIENGD